MGKTLRRIIAVGAFIGALATSACTPNDFVGLGKVLNGVEANRIARERGSQEIHIRGGGEGGGEPQQLDEDYIFAFEDVKDSNGNGRYELGEFSGVKKDKFYNNEGCSFCLFNTSKRGAVRFVFKDANGKILKDLTEKDTPRNWTLTRCPPENTPGSGRYTAEWYRDGVLIGKTEVDWYDEDNPNKRK